MKCSKKTFSTKFLNFQRIQLQNISVSQNNKIEITFNNYKNQEKMEVEIQNKEKKLQKKL